MTEKLPHVGQAFVIERHSTKKKTGESSVEIAYGLTDRRAEQAGPQRLPQANRGDWAIESCHYMIDWHYDEDRSRMRTDDTEKIVLFRTMKDNRVWRVVP